MPLDTGVLVEFDATRVRPSAARRGRLTLDPALDVGAALKAARESLGLTLDEISEATRVRTRLLVAIEAGDIEHLPSRPFAVGYVRAYARTLGLDADAAAARFRTEHPSPDDELHSPAGVKHQKPARNRTAGVLLGLVVVAVVGWNVARHALADPPRAAHVVAARIAGAPPPVASGPFHAGAPLPAPPEASIPAPYATPGLEAATAAGGSADAADAAVKAAAAAPTDAIDPAAPSAPFVAKGAIYGPTTGVSSLVIQARGPISLEVRGPGGVVYFARQLAAGEAYRVPNLPGLTAQASNPANAELFDGGVSKGPLGPMSPTQAATQVPLKVDAGAQTAWAASARAPAA